MGERVESGTAEIVSAPGGVCVIALGGYVTFDTLLRAMTLLDSNIARDPSTQGVVLDVLGIAGFEPGVPARAIQWVAARRKLVSAAVLVSTSPVLLATVRAAALMVREVEIYAVASRSEAISGVLSLVAPRRARQHTGVRRKTPDAGVSVQRLEGAPVAVGAGDVGAPVEQAPVREGRSAVVRMFPRNRAG